MILSSSELEGSGSRSRKISPVTSGGRESSVTKLGVMWLAVIPLVEGTSAVWWCVYYVFIRSECLYQLRGE